MGTQGGTTEEFFHAVQIFLVAFVLWSFSAVHLEIIKFIDLFVMC